MVESRLDNTKCPVDIAASYPKIVLTGGPGAGKTAVQNVARRHFKDRIVCVPESASILFAGGFPRGGEHKRRQAAQRAIYWVQRELEALYSYEGNENSVLLCDRGTVDGSAYWVDGENFWDHVGSNRDIEYARYHSVIHLAVPRLSEGYNHNNPLRIESAEEARQADQNICRAWSQHPRFFQIESNVDFVAKVQTAIEYIETALEDIASERKR